MKQAQDREREQKRKLRQARRPPGKAEAHQLVKEILRLKPPKVAKAQRAADAAERAKRLAFRQHAMLGRKLTQYVVGRLGKKLPRGFYVSTGDHLSTVDYGQKRFSPYIELVVKHPGLGIFEFKDGASVTKAETKLRWWPAKGDDIDAVIEAWATWLSASPVK